MDPWTTRTYLRSGFAAVLAGLTALGTALVGDQSIDPSETVTTLTAMVTAAGIWLGFGALPGTKIEPFYGSKDENAAVPVPSPPAVAAAPE